MKKFMWIAALLAALALIVSGCPGGGDDTGEGDTGTYTGAWYLATDDDGNHAANNQLTLNKKDDSDGRTYLRIFFDPTNVSFSKIKIDFTIDNGGANVCWQNVVDSTGKWGFNGDNYIEWLEEGPIEIDPSANFTQAWDATGSALDKKSMSVLCIYAVPSDPDDDPCPVFTLTGVSFTGLGSSGSEQENNGEENNWTGEVIEAANWFLSASEGGAAAADNAVTGSGEWYVYAYFNEAADDVKLYFTTTEGITLIKQCVFDDTGTWGWGWGDVTSGANFNLSGASSWGASGSALDKHSLKGICIKITGSGTFTLTKVELVK